MSAAIAAFQVKSLVVDDAATFPAVEPRFAGVIYPSLAMRGNSDNIALLPEFADKYVALEQVEYVRIDEVGSNLTYQITAIDFANSFGPDGSICWRGKPGSWTLRSGEQLKLSVENGQWVARDIQGKLVDFN